VAINFTNTLKIGKTNGYIVLSLRTVVDHKFTVVKTPGVVVVVVVVVVGWGSFADISLTKYLFPGTHNVRNREVGPGPGGGSLSF
jgi:hypothetical protein